MQGGHVTEEEEEEEFSLLIVYLFKRIQELIKVEKKSLNQVFELQDLCYSTIALLDGGLRREQRREVMCRLHVDSLICKNGEYYLKKQTEKTNRGNSHELAILDVGACLFLLWKKERDTLLKSNSTTKTLCSLFRVKGNYTDCCSIHNRIEDKV
jgi:hypothetical protein